MQMNPIPPCPAILIERICAPIRDYGLPVLTAATLVGIDPDLWPALCPRGSALAFAVRQAEAQFIHTLLKLLCKRQVRHHLDSVFETARSAICPCRPQAS